jgi:23S rRNA pseudouridine1911/1915/1917 synthase
MKDVGHISDEEDAPQEWVVTLEVPQGYREDARLDVYLTRFLPNASRAKVQVGLKEGQVTINGAMVDKASYRVQAGDRIVCRLRRAPPVEALPENIPLDILYEDAHLIVLNKPVGMVVHPAYANLTGTLVNALLYHVGSRGITLEEVDDVEDEDVGLSTLNAAPAAPGDVAIRPGIVHRLDKDTSGLMVVAKDDVSHRRLARQFEARTIQRRYQGIIWGVPDPAEGRIEGDIARDPRDRKRMAVVPSGKGKHAVTHFKTLEAFACAALLEFRLETGRTHQIRVHAKHMGHPLLGDVTYGGQSIHCGARSASRQAFFRNLFEAMPRQALHAYTLGFDHPHTGEPLQFAAPPPPDMQFVLERLRQVEPQSI